MFVSICKYGKKKLCWLFSVLTCKLTETFCSFKRGSPHVSEVMNQTLVFKKSQHVQFQVQSEVKVTLHDHFFPRQTDVAFKKVIK